MSVVLLLHSSKVNSFDELEKALNSHTEDILLSYFIDCGVGNEQVETIRAMAKAIQSNYTSLLVNSKKRIFMIGTTHGVIKCFSQAMLEKWSIFRRSPKNLSENSSIFIPHML